MKQSWQKLKLDVPNKKNVWKKKQKCEKGKQDFVINPTVLLTPTKSQHEDTVESEQLHDLGLTFSDSFPQYICNLHDKNVKLSTDEFSLYGGPVSPLPFIKIKNELKKNDRVAIVEQ